MTKRKTAALFKQGFVVAIDGPSGAGKSTVSKLLATALSGALLDTGAMYRSVAFHALKTGVKSARELGAIARALEFEVDRKTQALLVNGRDPGSKIRSTEVSDMASLVSRYKSVRSALTQRQRQLGRSLMKQGPVVVEGRDIGTVVFPEVKFKFYVTADAAVRAKRRFSQLKKQGWSHLSLNRVREMNEKRDKQDSQRKLAPLKVPDDAVVVDTSSMAISQVVRFMADHIRGVLTLSH